MKKIFLIMTLLVMGMSTALFAQSKVNIDESGLIKKIEKANAAVQKKPQDAGAWLSRGDAMMAAANAVPNTLYEMEEPVLVMMYGKTKAEIINRGNEKFIKYAYPYFDAYMDTSGVVRGWVINKEIYPNAVEEAIESYSKAYELNAGGKLTDKIGKGFESAYTYYYGLGTRQYAIRMFDESAALLEKAFNVTQLPGFKSSEENPAGAVSHDAGLAFYYSKNYEKSAQLFRKAIENSYQDDGTIYSLLAHALIQSAESREGAEKEALLTEAKEVLERGLKLHASNDSIIESLTDVYTRLGIDLNRIAPMITEAIEQNPDNPALWNSLARVYENNKEYDKAIQAYAKVVELVPGNAKAPFIYAIGYIYAQQAQELGDEYYNRSFASDAERDALANKMNNLYLKGLEYGEQAFNMQPDNTYFVNLLKIITFRMRTTSDEMAQKYEKYNELYKSLTGN